MADPLDRIVAYLSAPDVYDAPSLDELAAIRDEIKHLRVAKRELLAALAGLLEVHDALGAGQSHTATAARAAISKATGD